MICWHRWREWSELVPSYNDHKIQFRRCINCGKTQKRDLGYCDGVMATDANKALEKVARNEDFSV